MAWVLATPATATPGPEGRAGGVVVYLLRSGRCWRAGSLMVALTNNSASIFALRSTKTDHCHRRSHGHSVSAHSPSLALARRTAISWRLTRPSQKEERCPTGRDTGVAGCGTVHDRP